MAHAILGGGWAQQTRCHWGLSAGSLLSPRLLSHWISLAMSSALTHRSSWLSCTRTLRVAISLPKCSSLASSSWTLPSPSQRHGRPSSPILRCVEEERPSKPAWRGCASSLMRSESAPLQEIVASAVFPVMCHSEEDEELYESDPYEYVRRAHGAMCCRAPALYSSLLFSRPSLHALWFLTPQAFLSGSLHSLRSSDRSCP